MGLHAGSSTSTPARALNSPGAVMACTRPRAQIQTQRQKDKGGGDY